MHACILFLKTEKKISIVKNIQICVYRQGLYSGVLSAPSSANLQTMFLARWWPKHGLPVTNISNSIFSKTSWDRLWGVSCFVFQVQVGMCNTRWPGISWLCYLHGMCDRLLAIYSRTDRLSLIYFSITEINFQEKTGLQPFCRFDCQTWLCAVNNGNQFCASSNCLSFHSASLCVAL